MTDKYVPYAITATGERVHVPTCDAIRDCGTTEITHDHAVKLLAEGTHQPCGTCKPVITPAELEPLTERVLAYLKEHGPTPWLLLTGSLLGWADEKHFGGGGTLSGAVECSAADAIDEALSALELARKVLVMPVTGQGTPPLVVCMTTWQARWLASEVLEATRNTPCAGCGRPTTSGDHHAIEFTNNEANMPHLTVSSGTPGLFDGDTASVRLSKTEAAGLAKQLTAFAEAKEPRRKGGQTRWISSDCCAEREYER